MFGSDILDVMIGLALIYLLLSLVMTSLREAIESVLKTRAVHLERGLLELLASKELTTDLYNHPQIAPLYQGMYQPKENKRRRGATLPTYIPSKNFAVALMDLVLNPDGNSGQHPLSLSNLRTAAEGFPHNQVKRAVLNAIDTARGDLSQAQANIEAWFNSAMERVGGRYKRRTQWVLFGLSAITVTLLNVNTVTLANFLARNQAAREVLVSKAGVIVKDPMYQLAANAPADSTPPTNSAYADLTSLSLPLGWKAFPSTPIGGNFWYFWSQLVAGLLVTALALTLGAPFWFDLLSKFMSVRSTIKPKTAGT